VAAAVYDGAEGICCGLVVRGHRFGRVRGRSVRPNRELHGCFKPASLARRPLVALARCRPMKSGPDLRYRVESPDAGKAQENGVFCAVFEEWARGGVRGRRNLVASGGAVFGRLFAENDSPISEGWGRVIFGHRDGRLDLQDTEAVTSLGAAICRPSAIVPMAAMRGRPCAGGRGSSYARYRCRSYLTSRLGG